VGREGALTQLQGPEMDGDGIPAREGELGEGHRCHKRMRALGIRERAS
jgi:hypothetical protein